jgi:hypothetical protein
MSKFSYFFKSFTFFFFEIKIFFIYLTIYYIELKLIIGFLSLLAFKASNKVILNYSAHQKYMAKKENFYFSILNKVLSKDLKILKSIKFTFKVLN